MALDSLITLLPLNLVLIIVSGYFAYLSIIGGLKVLKEKSFKKIDLDAPIFSELKDKQKLATSIFAGIFFVSLLFVIYVSFNPEWSSSCKGTELGCLTEMNTLFLVSNLIIFSLFFAIFLFIYADVPISIRVGVFGLSFLVILVLLLLSFDPNADPLNFTNHFYRSPVIIEKSGENFNAKFFVINNNNTEKLLNKISLICNETDHYFTEQNCGSGLPYVLPPEKISVISCPIELDESLADCQTGRYVINGFTQPEFKIFEGDLLSHISEVS